MKKVIQLKFSRPLPSHSTLSPTLRRGEKPKVGRNTEKVKLCKQECPE